MSPKIAETNIIVKFHLTDKHGCEINLSQQTELLNFLSVEKSIRFLREMALAHVNCYTPQFLLKSQMYYFLQWILQEAENHQHHQYARRQIMPALGHMMSNLTVHSTMSDLSSMCAMSESTFRRLFKEALGTSPTQYLLKMRLEKAKVLLLDETATVSSVAESLDFYDAPYFCKQFRQLFGLTPGDYRKNRSQLPLL